MYGEQGNDLKTKPKLLTSYEVDEIQKKNNLLSTIKYCSKIHLIKRQKLNSDVGPHSYLY